MERLKNASLKKSLFLLSTGCVFFSLLLVLLVFWICNLFRENIPNGGVSFGYILGDGIQILQQPTPEQELLWNILSWTQLLSCIIFPLAGLGIAVILFYQIKLKEPILILRNGTERIKNQDLSSAIPVVSRDELGQVCQAFETMRLELLKINQELWRQSEERKRLNAAFAHDLRNPVTVLKGSLKLLRRNPSDDQTLDRLEFYTQRIEQYIEAMSSIQKLEQMPIQISEMIYTNLQAELEETARLLAPNLNPVLSVSTLSAPVSIRIDHGIFLTVAENLISNASRFAKEYLSVHLEIQGAFLLLSITDDGPGFSSELLKNGPKPFEKSKEYSQSQPEHFGMGLYSSHLLCFKHGGNLRLENKSDSIGGAIATASFQIY